MQIAAYFVEYLIIGSVTLVWSLPLFLLIGAEPPSNALSLALLAPFVYVVGMLVDVAGHVLTRRRRRKIRKNSGEKYRQRYRLSEIVDETVEAELFAHNADLAKAAVARKSRARVARGVTTNGVLAGSCWLTALIWSNADLVIVLVVAIGSLVAVWLFWLTWERWQRLAVRFNHRAVSEIRNRADTSGNAS